MSKIIKKIQIILTYAIFHSILLKNKNNILIMKIYIFLKFKILLKRCWMSFKMSWKMIKIKKLKKLYKKWIKIKKSCGFVKGVHKITKIQKFVVKNVIF